MTKEYEICNYKTRREIIYDDLKNQILRGKLIPGTRLMEVDLANKMGASRTPIREALKALAEDNLVTIEPNKGAYVSKISLKDLLEIIEIRESMDGTTAYLAAERITPTLKSKLIEAMEKYNEAAASNDQNMMIEWDTQFHKIIVEATGNKVMMQIAEQLRELVLRFRYLYYGDFGRAENVSAEHRDIVDAINERNPQKAREVAQYHIQNIREDLINREKILTFYKKV